MVTNFVCVYLKSLLYTLQVNELVDPTSFLVRAKSQAIAANISFV